MDGERQYVMASGSSPFGQGLYLYLDSPSGADVWRFAARSASSGNISPGGIPAQEGVWQHLVIRRSGDEVAIWGDGEIDAGSSVTLDEGVDPPTATWFGGLDDGFEFPFDRLTGAISQVTRWDSALEPEEIQSLADGAWPLSVSPDTRRWFIPFATPLTEVEGGAFTLEASPGVSSGAAPYVETPVLP